MCGPTSSSNGLALFAARARTSSSEVSVFMLALSAACAKGARSATAARQTIRMNLSGKRERPHVRMGMKSLSACDSGMSNWGREQRRCCVVAGRKPRQAGTGSPENTRRVGNEVSVFSVACAGVQVPPYRL